MQISNKVKIVLLALFCAVITTTVFGLFFNHTSTPIHLNVTLKSNEEIELKIYYTLEKESTTYTELNATEKIIKPNANDQNADFILPNNIENIRIDFGDKKNQIVIKKVKLSQKENQKIIPLKQYLSSKNLSGISAKVNSDSVLISTLNNDPHIDLGNVSDLIDSISNDEKSRLKNVLLVFVGSLIYFFIVFVLFKKIGKSYLKQFASDTLNSRKLIMNLAQNDLKSRFSGSFFGLFWSVLSPVLTIAVYWFVFQIGFKNSNIQDVPFILWFLPGIVPWLYFSDALSMITNSFTEYSYLVKKVVFNVNIIPLVKLMSVTFINFFFIIILFVIYLSYGQAITIYSVQFVYYWFALILFSWGVSLFTSSIAVFFKDLNQIIAIVLQFGFWLTPIVWDTSNAPGFLGNFFELNPLVYIIDGFRDSFLYHKWFFDKPIESVYFWSLSLIIILIGILINKKLKSHFSDVL